MPWQKIGREERRAAPSQASFCQNVLDFSGTKDLRMQIVKMSVPTSRADPVRRNGKTLSHPPPARKRNCDATRGGTIRDGARLEAAPPEVTRHFFKKFCATSRGAASCRAIPQDAMSARDQGKHWFFRMFSAFLGPRSQTTHSPPAFQCPRSGFHCFQCRPPSRSPSARTRQDAASPTAGRRTGGTGASPVHLRIKAHGLQIPCPPPCTSPTFHIRG